MANYQLNAELTGIASSIDSSSACGAKLLASHSKCNQASRGECNQKRTAYPGECSQEYSVECQWRNHKEAPAHLVAGIHRPVWTKNSSQRGNQCIHVH